jgi:hypothetical protein
MGDSKITSWMGFDQQGMRSEGKPLLDEAMPEKQRTIDIDPVMIVAMLMSDQCY